MKNECQLPVVDMTVEQRHVICGQAQRRHGLDQESELTTPVNAEHRGTASNIFKANVQSQSARVQFLLNSKQGKTWKHCQKMPNSACGKATSCIWHLATGAQTSLTAMAASGCLLQIRLENSLPHASNRENFRKLISLWKPSLQTFHRLTTTECLVRKEVTGNACSSNDTKKRKLDQSNLL